MAGDDSNINDIARKAWTAIEKHIPLEGAQRDALVHESIDAFKSATTSGARDGANSLRTGEHSLADLQKLDGGANSKQFKEDLATINEAINPAKEHSAQHLPFLSLVDVNNSGHAEVFDQTTGKRETLSFKQGLLEPSAAAENTALYVGNGHKGAEAWRDAIKPENVQQGRLGDCYFLAPLQALADRDPQAIHNMIRENGVGPDGQRTYTVTFPGAKDHPITVGEPSTYDTTAFAQSGGGTWVNVLEEAHRKLLGSNWDRGGDPQDAMKLLTGNDSVRVKMKDDQLDGAVLGRLLQGSLGDKGSLLVAGAFKPSTVVDAAGNTVDIIGPHEYSVVKVDAKTNMITLSNPQGLNGVEGASKPEAGNVHAPNKFDGVLSKTEPAVASLPAIGRLVTMPMKEFRRAFDIIDIGHTPDAK